MNRIEGTEYFRDQLVKTFRRRKIVPVFPDFLNRQPDEKAQQAMKHLRQRAPAPSEEFDKYAFVGWVADELVKQDSFMSVPALIELVNAQGYETNYGTEYSGLRGSYRLVRGAYHRMKRLGTPEGDKKAENIALAFRKPNFEYAYE